VTNVGETQEQYCNLVNAEGQYSLWPAFREPPPGWTLTGPCGGRQTCLGWIEAHWTEMGPRLERLGNSRAGAIPERPTGRM